LIVLNCSLNNYKTIPATNIKMSIATAPLPVSGGGTTYDSTYDSLTNVVKVTTTPLPALAAPEPKRTSLRRDRAATLDIDILYDQPLGYGFNGAVYAGTMRATGEKVAVKILPAGAAATREAQHHLACLPHPHIVDIRAAYECCVPFEAGAPSEPAIVLALEYMSGGGLIQLVNSTEPPTSAQSADILRQMATALEHVHAAGFHHGDIKLENALYSRGPGQELTVKLADFGFCRHGPTTNHSDYTPYYVAPEILAAQTDLTFGSDKPAHHTASDMWSLGVVAYALYTRSLPFVSRFVSQRIPLPSELRFKILQAKYEAPRTTDAAARELIAALLAKDPAARLTATEVLHHPALLVKDPAARLTATEVLHHPALDL
jgi:serine/threonine protein kinase